MLRTGLPASRLRGNAFPTRLLVILFIACLYQAVPNTSHAENICVTTPGDLNDALSTAANNGESDNIRVRRGIIASANRFNYQGENFDLTLSGGWSENCVFPETRDPFATYITRVTEGRILFFNQAGGNFHMENLSFMDGNAPSSTVVFIGSNNTLFPLEVTIDRVAIVGTIAGRSLVVSGDDLRIRNSLFHQNASNSSEPTIRIGGTDSLYFTNNTVVSNTSSDPIGSLDLPDDAATEILLANNIFWDNDGLDLDIVTNNSTIVMKNNNIELLLGVPDPDSVNNLSVDPMFEMDSYTPRFDSLMVDAGTKPPNTLPDPIPFHQWWSVGSKDFNYDDREQGARVDIGAIEAFPEIIFGDGYE